MFRCLSFHYIRILAFFEPENCWFAASENTNIRLEKAGVKHHLVPKQVFENGGIGANLECEYNEKCLGISYPQLRACSDIGY